MENVVSPMITAIGDALTALIGWVGNVVTALTGTSGALAPLLPIFAIGIGVSVLAYNLERNKTLVGYTTTIADKNILAEC